MINFYLVDIKTITSDVPRSNFAEADLESLANMILETGGIIRPLILKPIGAETYTVVDGHFEYYAAVRAREKNPREAEMVNAFVISPKKQDLVVKQAAVLRGVESIEKIAKPNTGITNLEARLTNLELRFEKQINELKSEQVQERQRMNDKFKEFANLIPQQIEPLSLLNTLDKDELYIKLQRSRISGSEKLAKAIVDARRKKPKQEFENYRDVVDSVKGLGDKTVLTIIDEWKSN